MYYNSDVNSSGLPRNVDDILSATKLPIPSPTVLFARPDHLQGLSTAVLSRAKKSSFTYPVVWRHKLAALAEGFLSKESLWDRVVFDGAREYVMGRMASTLKAVVVSGGDCFLAILSMQILTNWFSRSIIERRINPSEDFTLGPIHQCACSCIDKRPHVCYACL